MDPEDGGEVPLTGGWVTSGVVRVGETVRRPAGPNALLLQQLLAHLEEIGFEAAPRFLGIDEQGREILTFIEGDVPSDCRSIVWTDEQLVAAARLLRRFHDATAGSELAGGFDVVCHNDFGPWNLIWRDEMPVAMIDFDNAAPGARRDDLGYALWKHLNLGLIDCERHEQARRLRLMTESYGVPVDDSLMDAIKQAQERMRSLIEAALEADGSSEALRQNELERAWLSENRQPLLSAAS